MREVSLDRCHGRLFLDGMPGRYNAYNADAQAILDAQVDDVIALASWEETHKKSPDYADAIESGQLPFSRIEFTIPDYGVPTDRDAYLELVKSSAAKLLAGKNLLIHCGAGIGRTGTVAASILTALGYPLDDALSLVKEAGSGPETDEQRSLVEWTSKEI